MTVKHHCLNELSLFSGCGGGLLASQYFLNWRTIGYVEIDDYCQRIIRQRMDDGLLDTGPIFCDIKTFIRDGYAEQYKNVADVITAGFPCQPFSVAGKQKGESDSRNMWPATCEVIDIIQPPYAFLENVPGIINCGYIGDVLSDLAQIGYDAKWVNLSASDCGAWHKRERIWIVAYTKSKRLEMKKSERQLREYDRLSSELYKRISDTTDTRLKNMREWKVKTAYWDVEPELGRMADGVANRVDRIKAIGNGQVPQVVASAWNFLTGGEL